MRPVSKRLTTLTAIFACILIVCAASVGVLLYYQYANRPKPVDKKAFILLPGLMESSLADPEYENTALWSADYSWATSRIEEDPLFLTEYVPSLFEYDEEDKPVVALAPLSASSVRSDGYDKDKYGFGGIFGSLYEYLTAEYGDGYDIIVWQYDWRCGNEVSAAQLEQFVNGNGYTHVALISHGMGGNVAVKYLDNVDNRIKTEFFIPIAAPFFGSLDTLTKLFPQEAPVSEDTPYSAIIETLGLSNINNIPAFAELLPYPAMSRLSYYGTEEAPILLSGETVPYNELYDYFCSQDFAKNDSHSLKKTYETLIEYQRRDFIKTDGVYKHITEFVDTVYVAGVGKETESTTNIDTSLGKIISFGYDSMGDGTVWAYSATAGHALDSDNVIIIDGDSYEGHYNLIDNTAVIEKLKQAIKDRVI